METTVESSPMSDDEEFAPKRVANYRSIIDSDSEEETPLQNVEVSKPRDESDENSDKSSSSSSDEEEPAPKLDRRKNANPKKNFLPVKTQRKSAAKAKEMIKEKMSHKQQEELKTKIQSEKQRMEREQDIRVPYHKPKQMSLKEFLSRRTINKPSMDKIRKGEMPMSTVMAIKMRGRGEGLEKFAQEMKEREEEAIEFFKSESESEDEADQADNKENVSENAQAVSSNQEVKDVEIEVVPSVAEPEVGETPATEIVEENSHQVTEPVIEQVDTAVAKQEVTKEEDIEAPKKEDSVLERLREKYKNVGFAEIKIPTLKTLQEMGSNNSIDLGTGLIEPRKLSGPEQLFQRYLKTVQIPKPKSSICMNILTVENGKLENQKVKVKLTKETEVDHERPGLARGKLQGNLLSQIKQKRHEEIMKRIETRPPVELEPEDKDEKCDEEPSEEEESTEGESEPEEEPEITESKKKRTAGGGFFDEEAIDEDEPEQVDEGDESENESSSSSESETESVAPKKGRILKAFVDSDDEESNKVDNIVTAPVHENAETNESCLKPFTEDPFAFTQDINLKNSEEVSTSEATEFTFTEPSVSEDTKRDGAGPLWDSGPSQMDDDDFMEILSGGFSTTQGFSSSAQPEEASKGDFGDSQFVSQVPEKSNEGNPENAKKPEVPESIVDEPVKAVSPAINHRKLLDSSEDEADVAANKVKRKKLRKKRKQKVVKLGFSDDDSDSASDQAPELEESGSENLEECEEEEEPDVLVDYDSEENEVEVKMNKKERIKAAGAYFEKEAELSESEWGSADENEENLDKFEGELGDEDQFDQAKLQEEVGRIHARKVLDDDIRNVKKIEELLFEDEEIDGVGRERKFRWKNQKEGFAPADENAMDGDLLEDGDDEFESETAWRKMRHERETLLSEHALKFTESDTMADEITLIDHESQTVTSTSTSAFITQKFKIIKSSSAMECPSTTEVKKDSPFLIKTANFKKFRNSSFLSRDEQTLNKIARMVSHKDDEVTNFSHGSNSMSFLTIDKPEESKKRKSAGPTLKSPDMSKKRKVEIKSKILLLDQLN